MSPQEQPRLAVLISGRGSNLQAFIDACTSGELDAQIGLVISNNPEAAGLQRAVRAGLTARSIDHRNYSTREAFDQALVDELRAHSVDLVVLAGFMRILKGEFLRAFSDRVINIHPSLLPSFPGLEAWRQALEYGVKVTGCTVHFVDQGVDTGAIIAQQTVLVRDDDTAGTLHARVQAAEHELYPAAIRLLAEGHAQVRGRRVLNVARSS